MALTISPGAFLLTVLIGRIHFNYAVKQTDIHVTLVGGNVLSGQGLQLTSSHCKYRINIDVEEGDEGKLVFYYWEGGELMHQDSFGPQTGEERREAFEELRKVLDGEVTFDS